jgi:hypothetical protein
MFVNRRKPAVPVLASLLVAAAIPGLISYADPHRLAAFYPAVCAVASCTAAAGLAGLRSRFPKTAAAATGALVLIALPLALARSGALYFSRPEGEPPTQTIARTIKAEVAPGTLLVLDLPFGLMVDTSYLLFDASLVEPFGWIDEDKWREEFHDFKPRFADVFHVDTALRHRIPELEKTEWKRLLFVFHQDLEPEAKLAALREEFGAVDVKQIRPPTWRGAGEPMLTFATVTPHAG